MTAVSDMVQRHVRISNKCQGVAWNYVEKPGQRRGLLLQQNDSDCSFTCFKDIGAHQLAVKPQAE
jgi:hypothetical protein